MSAIAQVQEPKVQEAHEIAFKHILVATDFSPASDRALQHALAIGARYDAAISVLHANSPQPHEPIPMDPMPRELDRQLLSSEREMQRLELEVEQKNLAHRIRIERGPVWDVLSSVIEQDHPDLLVLGTHGRGGLEKLVLGSVAEQVLRLAPCPVLTVGPKSPAPQSYPANFKCILFATDFGPESVKAFPYAQVLAENCGAKLIVLHAVVPLTASAYYPADYAPTDLAEYENRIRQQTLQKLEDTFPAAPHHSRRPEYVVATGFPADGILEAAAMRKADLLVLGAGDTWSARVTAHLPGLIHEVLCQAACPVLTVKN